jgi:hypothetical protein
MGDLYKKVWVYGLKDGKVTAAKPAAVKALVDTGATLTILSSRVVEYLQARTVPLFAYLDGIAYTSASVGVIVDAKGCKAVPLMVVVDDQLASKAGQGADMILGHDYQQNQRMVLSLDNMQERQTARCRPPSKAKSKRAA